MLKYRNLVILILIHRTTFSYSSKLKLSSVIFRHGDREPDDSVHGGLTVAGKRRAYYLGEILRDMYGDEFLRYGCYARSTEYTRTKMSLQLVLAALYNVISGPRRWHDSLNWQPIPFAYARQTRDILLFTKSCPSFKQEFDRAKSTPGFQKLLDPYRDMLNELTALTGEKMESSFHMFLLYHKLAAMRSMNQSLPSWSKNIFPDGLLLNGTYLEYDVLKYTDLMRKLNGGALMRKVIDDMLGKVTNESDSRINLFLYSAHELNIVALLQTLKIWNPHIPRYTSSIIIELLGDHNDHYVRVLYYKGVPSDFEEMQIPGCSSPCSLTEFIGSISDQLPNHDQMICG